MWPMFTFIQLFPKDFYNLYVFQKNQYLMKVQALQFLLSLGFLHLFSIFSLE